MRVINADEYMNSLRANIDTTADIIAKHIKEDEPIGTVKDGGQIGYLWALQWARNRLESDYYTVSAIPIPDNATNGDIIKALFNETEYPKLIRLLMTSDSFWNAPYKGGQDNDN